MLALLSPTIKTSENKMLLSLQSVVGLLVIIFGCALFSATRADIRPTIVVKALAVQVVFALILLKLPGSRYFFELLNQAIDTLIRATQEGSSFIFGFLGGGELPYQETGAGSSLVLAFRTLPLVIVVSALSAILVYWRVLPLIMKAMSKLLEKTLNIGGAVGLAISANAFLGMVESPLLIKPYLARLSRSELFSVMMAGMATIAGSMLAIEAAVIGDVVPNAVGHLLSASLITLPAVVYVSHLLIPNTGSITGSDQDVDSDADSLMDAIVKGTQSGLQVFLNIIAMVIVIVALVYLVNATLGLLPDIFGEAITLERILGVLLAPLTWLLGIPWSEAVTTGQLMGVKTVLTEFIAYVRLGELPVDALSERSKIIITYALCGFANFVSLGIMIAGLVTMVPERRQEILSLGTKSIVGGTLATCSTACLVGIIL